MARGRVSATITGMAVPASVGRLRDRWRGPEGQERATRVVSALATGSPISSLGLDRIGGRLDVRGLWLVSTRDLPAECITGLSIQTLPGVEWRELDFSHSTLSLNLISADVGDCCFDGVGYRTWRVVDSNLDRCTFARADLRDSHLDGWNSGMQRDPNGHPSSRYVDCTFTRTRFGPYDGFGRATFTRCTFDRTSFPSPMWMYGANFADCTFSGDFRTVCFGSPGKGTGEPAPLLDNVDASAASFASLETYRYKGSGIAVREGQEVIAQFDA
jgi:uncharacterized protein YjbI with pentapeptide repeats